ncbi:glycosyltransferase family 2 protein [Leifsonia sp. fls2-241-R2A-40a]|uniref:glycosyltransferase n=1 Tax=Leifsonia sp. fls2-241-R2A-40a TaxID=3040290 RepID=UPI00254A95A7|nr:glycosyltransferase family 2 protein [Leifsonia sp. fls2-241-R2A-40a]
MESASSATAVVVVNYAAAALVAENLRGLQAERPDVLFVVVDSYSGAEERERARRLAAERGWDLVTPYVNVGFGGGCDLGVARALERGADRVLLLNPDARLAEGALALLEAEVAADPLALVAPRIDRPDGSVWSVGSDLYLADGRIRSPRARDRFPGAERAFWLSGACLLLSRELWERVGGFRDDYFLYWEDVDLSWQVVTVGGRLVVREDAHAVHAEGGTQGTAEHDQGRQSSGEPKSDVYYFHNIRNRLVFARLNLPEETVARWRGLRLSLRIAWEVLLQGGRRQLLRRPGLLLLAARAVREGRRFAASPTKRGQKGENSSR